MEKGITNGVDATHFNPTGECCRAVILTMIYRYLGQPEPTTTELPFEDVPADAFYRNAVLWAVENEITNGIDDTHFAPLMVCNRAVAVTFLYRAVKK